MRVGGGMGGPQMVPAPPALSAARPPVPPPPPEPEHPTVSISDLLQQPGRQTRPTNLVIVLRGPPGSGKTYTAKLIKDQEVANKGSAPRILSLDDYFCTEKEKSVTDPDTGRSTTKKVMEYEYDAGLEEAYRASLHKVFRKTVDDGFFHFIIIDCVNSRTQHYDAMCTYAMSRGFKVYVAEMDMDVAACHKRNVHGRSQSEIAELVTSWQATPARYVRVDVRPLLQDDSIQEVEMEDSVEPSPPAADAGETADSAAEASGGAAAGGSISGLQPTAGDSADGRPPVPTQQQQSRASRWGPVPPPPPPPPPPPSEPQSAATPPTVAPGPAAAPLEAVGPTPLPSGASPGKSVSHPPPGQPPTQPRLLDPSPRQPDPSPRLSGPSPGPGPAGPPPWQRGGSRWSGPAGGRPPSAPGGPGGGPGRWPTPIRPMVWRQRPPRPQRTTPW